MAAPRARDAATQNPGGPGHAAQGFTGTNQRRSQPVVADGFRRAPGLARGAGKGKQRILWCLPSPKTSKKTYYQRHAEQIKKTRRAHDDRERDTQRKRPGWPETPNVIKPTRRPMTENARRPHGRKPAREQRPPETPRPLGQLRMIVQAYPDSLGRTSTASGRRAARDCPGGQPIASCRWPAAPPS